MSSSPQTVEAQPSTTIRDYALMSGAADEDVDVLSEEMLVNMGPQHPSTHGVLRIVLRTDGEMVLDAVPHVGYLHRCKEKIGENLAYYQFIGYTDRLDYLAAMNNNHAWAMAVEKLAGIEVPPRAEYIRVIAAELNRIASHLVSFGSYGLDMGAFTPFLYAFREREYILDLFEEMCGARLTLSYINVGGVTWDLPPRFLEKLSEFLDYFEPKVDEFNDLLSFNRIFIKPSPAPCCAARGSLSTCAATGPTASTPSSTSTSVSARAAWAPWATAGTATGCAWPRSNSACGSCGSASARFPPVPSEPNFRGR
jgi:NADH-quinone oxidoreductase subunit D